MTLVAGFKCNDGFVLAADTEITLGTVRYQGHKLANYFGQSTSYDIVIGGAGDSVYVDMTCQKIRDVVAAISEPALATIKTEVGRIVSDVHDNYIFKHWEPGDPNRPFVQLIIGVEDKRKEWSLLCTDRNTIAEVDGFVVVGSGSELAAHLTEKLWISGLSTAVTVHLAQQLFREVKGKGIYVGGNTEVIGRRVTKDAEPFFDVSQKDYRFLWGLEELLLSAVRVGLNIGVDKQQIEGRVADIRARLVSIRDDSEKARSSRGDTIYLTEFGSEYGDRFKDF